jgi:integrase
MASDEGIKQTSKNRWTVRVKRVEKKTGRVVNRKATVTGTKADARKVREELRAELGSTTLTRPRTRLHAYAESWLALRSANPEAKRSGIRKYGYGLTHVIPVLGDLYLDAISPDDVRSYVAGRVAEAGIKGGNTVLNELRMLRTIARDSVAEGYAPTYWCDRVKPPKVREYTRERPNLLTGPQFRTLLEVIPTQWRGLILLIATTGLRWGEASALHWEDVDVAAGEAVIRWGNDRGERITVKTKGSNRTVPLLPEVVAMWGLKRNRGPIFPTRQGTLHKGTPLKKVLDKACAKAKVPRTTTHGLRRTFNNLARRDTSALVLKSITGHSTDAMMEHYSMVGTDEKTVVSRAVGTLIGVPEVSRSMSEE